MSHDTPQFRYLANEAPKDNPVEVTWSTTSLVIGVLLGGAVGALAMHLQMKGEEKNT